MLGIGEVEGAKASTHTPHLVVQVVDGGKGAQRVVAHAHVGVAHFQRKVQRRQHRGRVHQLRRVVQHARAQQDVPILDGRHIDEHQVGAGASTHALLEVGGLPIGCGLKRKQHLLVERLGEIELGGVKVLADL
jgi:hypothetical protein